jgi:hypothetical protein
MELLFRRTAERSHPCYNFTCENGSFEPFIYKTHHFIKTGSGQTLGNSKKDYRFLAGDGIQWSGPAGGAGGMTTTGTGPGVCAKQP